MISSKRNGARAPATFAVNQSETRSCWMPRTSPLGRCLAHGRDSISGGELDADFAERRRSRPGPGPRARPRRCPCSSPSLRGRLPRARAPAAPARSPASAARGAASPARSRPRPRVTSRSFRNETISSAARSSPRKPVCAGPWTQALCSTLSAIASAGESLRQSAKRESTSSKDGNATLDRVRDLRGRVGRRARGQGARHAHPDLGLDHARRRSPTRAARPGSRTPGPRGAGRTPATESRAPAAAPGSCTRSCSPPSDPDRRRSDPERRRPRPDPPGAHSTGRGPRWPPRAARLEQELRGPFDRHGRSCATNGDLAQPDWNMF